MFDVIFSSWKVRWECGITIPCVSRLSLDFGEYAAGPGEKETSELYFFDLCMVNAGAFFITAFFSALLI